MLLTALPTPVHSTIFIGPKYDELAVKLQSREKYNHRLNETISSIDRQFAGTKIKTDTAEDTELLKDKKKFIATYKEMIEDHVERRVAVFFQQLVISYKTHLHFEIGKTLHQAESAKALYLKNHKNKTSKLCKRNAAHSSTLPCVIAYNGKLWKKHIENNTPKPDGFVYAKNGGTYRRANSTLDMPRAINEADIEIDGDSLHPNLARDYAIKLLNKSASGKITPVQGLKKFLKKISILSQQKMNTSNKGEDVKTALSIFKDTFEQIIENIQTDSEVFDQLLSVKVDENHKDTDIKNTIYALRYKAIRDNQYNESEMIDKVNSVRAKVLKVVGPKRKPTYFDDAFLTLLCEQIPSKKNRKRISKLFNNPQDHYFNQANNKKAKFEKTKDLIENKQLKVIKSLAKDLSIELRNLKRQEILTRGLTTRALRESMKWTQKELAEKIKSVYEEAAASQPTISRIENNIKLVDEKYAKQLAHVFKVDTALLMPSFFCS